MISGLDLKYLNGERLVMARGYESPLPGSSQNNLTSPLEGLTVPCSEASSGGAELNQAFAQIAR